MVFLLRVETEVELNLTHFQESGFGFAPWPPRPVWWCGGYRWGGYKAESLWRDRWLMLGKCHADMYAMFYVIRCRMGNAIA